MTKSGTQPRLLEGVSRQVPTHPDFYCEGALATSRKVGLRQTDKHVAEAQQNQECRAKPEDAFPELRLTGYEEVGGELAPNMGPVVEGKRLCTEQATGEEGGERNLFILLLQYVQKGG